MAAQQPAFPQIQPLPQPVAPLPAAQRADQASQDPRDANGFVIRLPTITQGVSHVLTTLGIVHDVAYTAVPGNQDLATVRAMEKPARRTHLVLTAIRLLFQQPNKPEAECLAAIGAPNNPIKLPCEYLVSLWSEQIREKTWVDALTQEEQVEFARRKNVRNAEYRACEQLRAQAAEAMRTYMAYLDRREANAQQNLSNWVDRHLPAIVNIPGAAPDPLVAQWNAFAQHANIPVNQMAGDGGGDGN
uniref:Capsid protein n=1 Tax=Conidiobolus taihushanensis virus 1 TaxID=3229901 RepID=A0AAU7YSV0_9VIRU